ncbi:MAG: hypothetical protein AAGI44_08580 [Pseudomonadota bacterium]
MKMNSITKAVAQKYGDHGETLAEFTCPVNICPRLLALYPHGYKQKRLISRSTERAAQAVAFVESMGEKRCDSVEFSLDCMGTGELPLSLQADLIDTVMGQQIVRIGLGQRIRTYA